jgi:uncharacterized membrane protein YfcA
MIAEASSLVVLLLAAFIAGALNAAAGGGSFLTYPALIFAGVPPVAANATGAFAQLPGYASSAVESRRDIEPVGGVGPGLIAVTAMLGGSLGAALLLVTSNAAFRAVLPWLMLVATILFAAGPRIARAMSRSRLQGRAGLLGALFSISVYGGYFSGGYGILLMALLSIFGARTLNVVNGLKNVASTGMSLIAVTAYAIGGAIRWNEGLIMMVGAVLGGYFGARLARLIPEAALRIAIICIGAMITTAFFWREYGG